MDYGTVELVGDVQMDTDDMDICFHDGVLVADEFAPAEPATITTTYLGKFGTSETDKSACFTSTTRGVTWAEGILYINGLLKGEKGSYVSFADAFAAGETKLTLLADHDGGAELTGDLYLDLNGKTLTGDITGAGTLYGADSATDDYTAENAGRITGTVSCAVAKQFKNSSAKRYMSIADEDGYSFHRFYLGITHATLKPTTCGVGYKAVFAGSDLVKAHVDAFGYSLQLEGNDAVTREKAGTEFVSMQTVTLRVDNYNAEKWGTKGLTAQVYMVIDGETVYSTACTYTLQQLVENINANTGSYDAAALSAIAAWIAQSDVMKSWKVENIYTA